jgi:hypothetical protein
MVHFEDIWEEAETLSEQLEPNTDTIITELHKRVDNIKTGLTLPARRQAVNIGEILFDLCTLAKLVSRPEDSCNVAAGLRLAIENRKAQHLDPEEPD